MADRLKIKEALRQPRIFAAYAARRFLHDRCLRVAASLSYTSLLALVPLAALSFAVMTAFPTFENIEEQVQDFIFENVMPEAIGPVQEHFNSFVDNAGQMTAIGIAGLTVTAMLLLSTIESAVNATFRVTEKRSLAAKLMVFWAILTLGPMLLGASFSLSSHILSLTKEVGSDAFTGLFGRLLRLVPAMIAVGAFSIFYFMVPNRPVRWRHALAGGLVAGLMFSALRWVFGVYLIYFPSYQTIYGAVSVIPIFLVWMYLSWTVILIGAVVAASLPVWRRAGTGKRLTDLGAGELMVLALGILSALMEASRAGVGVRRRRLVEMTKADEWAVDSILTQLSKAGFVDYTVGRRWVMVRDATTTTLFDLYGALGLDAEMSAAGVAPDDPGWQARLAKVAAAANQSRRDLLAVSLREFFKAP